MKKVDLAIFVFCVMFLLVSSTQAAKKWRGPRNTKFHHARGRTRNLARKKVDKSILKSTDEGAVDKTDNDCGGYLEQLSGTLSHRMYSDNEACTWTIHVDDGMVIRLSFSLFDIESCESCECDMLSIYELSSPDPAMTLCGSDIPGDYTSTSSVLIVDFKSDASITRGGFELHWQAEGNQVVDEQGTAGISDSGQVSSPGFDEGKNYENNLEMEWTIENKKGAMSLTLEFYSFELEACKDCTCDWLKIYEADMTLPTYKLCGSQYPKVLVLRVASIRIKFSTDRTVTRRGFSMYWSWNYSDVPWQNDFVSSDLAVCGDELKNEGSFSSPGYDDDSLYPRSAYCTWIIESQSSRIQLTFENIDLDGCTSCYCSCDKIKIYDPYLVSFDKPSVQLCEDWSEEVVITSSANYLKVVLEADDVGGSRGFLASWKPFESVPKETPHLKKCGFDSTMDYGSIASPWYPNPYPNDLNCTWNILTRGQITLVIEDFSVQRCGPDCLCDWVEIVRPEMPAIRLCGNVNLGPLEKLGSVITIRFVSDASVTSSGFTIHWTTMHNNEAESYPGTTAPSCSSYNGSCGIPSILPRQIPVSGTPAIPYSWPWQVSIQLAESWDHRCSGTIITQRYVLTAAHCVFGKQPADVKVSVGEYDLKNPTTDSVSYNVERILNHPHFDQSIWSNDIAILELTNDIVFGITARPVCLSDMPISESLVCTYTGFQAAKFEHLLSELPMVILTELDSCTNVQDPVTTASPLFSPLFIDIGAPLVCKQGEVWRQYGIFSRTISCRDSDVAVFTSVDQFLEWIHAALEGLELPVSESDECLDINHPVLLSKPSGSIVAPGLFLNDHYISNAKCAWRIIAPENMVIRLRFEFIDIEHSQPCSYDVLSIFDGYNMDSPLVLTLCGSEPQEDFFSTKNSVYVVFTSDLTLEARGFIIHYEVNYGNTQPPDETRHCGRAEINPEFPRIVGGMEATPHSWPWQVSIQTNGNHFCGGTLVSSRWVITAAHCFGSYRPDQVTVVLGEHNLEYAGTELTVSVKRLILYDNRPYLENDIALLELETRLEFTSSISPACISHDVAVHDLICVATGWGSTGMEYPAVLRQVRLPIISFHFCNESYPNAIKPSMICAGYLEGGKDTCQGDSGGPLVCKVAGSYFLYGITSWGRGCAEAGSPGVYVSVSHFISWIEEQTEGEVLPTY